MPNLRKYSAAFLDELREPRKVSVMVVGVLTGFRISHFPFMTRSTLLA
jgi:hypothetical protein